MLDTLSPVTGLVPLSNPITEQGRATTGRPFGLTLARQAGPLPALDLADLVYDPETQMIECGKGQPAPRTTTQTTTTNTKTTHDHQSWNDSSKDTYAD